MTQLRLDPLTGRWVAVSTDRSERPSAFLPTILPVQADTSRPCPFCPGNEESTPPALETYSESGAWLVRVVPNLYPAFQGEAPMVVNHRGPLFTEAPASGIHEVLVLCPQHDLGWDRLGDLQTGLVMAAIRDRIDEHASTEGLRYTQVIVNAGREAGASVEHPHAQLLAMSFVPRELQDELAGFARFAGGCLLCAAVEAEEAARVRVVYEDDRVMVFCPFWSGMPFEMLAVPRSHSSHLRKSPMADLRAVGESLRTTVSQLRELTGPIAYNLVFHTAPYHKTGSYHWHVHIWPKLTTRAGFELGTGVSINVVSPERAAQELKDVVPALQAV